MAGIFNYYHGEEGTIRALTAQRDGRDLKRCLELDDNPHRTVAFDYGSDIIIDPTLVSGDRARFARLTQYDGVWVRESEFELPLVVQAANRAVKARGEYLGPNGFKGRFPDISADEAADSEEITFDEKRYSERPSTDATFFLSYSSTDVLIARSVVRDLQYDTNVDVWFDLAQGGAGEDWPQERAERWLREAVFNSKGLILLLSDDAAGSLWVQKELRWACEHSQVEENFRFVVIKLADVRTPEQLPANTVVIDGNGLWAINGMMEELMAAVFNREGRVSWAKRNPGIDGISYHSEKLMSYSDFESHSGIAVRLDKSLSNGSAFWCLEYEADDRIIRIEDVDKDGIVDPDIKCGDLIGFFIFNRNELGYRFWPGHRVWMRSDDINVHPEDVMTRYAEVRKIKPGTTGS